jgi:apolipoprotein N-acyltransferase
MPNVLSDAETIRIRAIQGGVPERGLEFNQRAQAVLDNHIKTTEKDFRSGDELIIWPENAIDIDPTKNSLVESKLLELARTTGTPLIAGAILDRDKIYNSTIYFDSNGTIQSTYIKRYLTPFGEYIPLRSLAAKVSSHVDRVNDFSPGSNLVVHQLPQARVGSVICYEILNDGLVKDMAVNSDFLVVHTNSATFSGSSEGEQQLAITRLRALESGKSIVSVSTTGPSAIIDARGVVLSKLDDGEVGSLSAEISLESERSFAHKLGGYGPLIALLLTLIWALLSLRPLNTRRGLT